ncbi:hypothetical protein N825_10380 [Skermanella stibiiresistens SB22]|uniref:Uncharacterized protein n=1 Tax=Skermanella stibiiresistens SB22 TaxID=1385369 RepID=W9H5C1_9PROT|nr:hypothetical protein N825_10380 [Skermanella stibiiresistens SB22]
MRQKVVEVAIDMTPATLAKFWYMIIEIILSSYSI